MAQSPRNFFTTVETRLGNDGLSSNSLSQDIQNLIRNNQVTRTQVDYIQRKLDLAQNTWRNAFNSISNYSDPGFEKSATLDLINGKIGNLNTVQRSLNSLRGPV
ncbi:hypothetical protein GP486_004873 [Trichoglossum hirsutum]|uniref:Uncharacterized protein n=1 Tax=Trichoglossum hirsutum TaxID=265104 RepID=A0A9P8RNA9_9PEZI|nr:hypothetical protein GP486_004873 [Trichoglossum hirsutum]